MNDSLEFIDNTLQAYSNHQNLQDHLFELVQNLYKDLESERNSNAVLQETIKDLTKQNTFGITTKLMNLKADHVKLKHKLRILQSEHDDLNIQLIAKSEESKHLLSEKQKEIQSYYKNMLQEKDDIIKKIERETQESKKDFLTKEQAFYNELRTVESTNDVKLNQMETDFKKQYHESNKKLKDYMDTCTVLRVELMSVKEQFAEYKRTANEKIQLLQKRLRENPADDGSTESETFIADTSLDRYKPLNMTCKKSVTEDKPVNLKQIPVYRHSGGKTPEKTCSNVPKKRRLFNPNDLSYLNTD